MIVVDASVVTAFLLDDEEAGERARVAMADEAFCAPHLIDCEVASAIRRVRLNGGVGDARALQALSDLADLSLLRLPHTHLLWRMWELHATVTPYDAAYVALAEVLDAPLLTADRRLARADGPTCRFEVL